MAIGETANLLVKLDLIDNLSSGISKAQGEISALDAQATKTSSSVSSLANTAKAAAVGFVAFAAAAGVTGLLSDAVHAASEEEASIRKLTQALQANVPAWNGDVDAIEQNIRAREQLGFTDDALRDSFTRLVSATHDVAEAQAAQATAMDLARFKGISLAEASQALVTVEAGRYRALASLGIQIKANATQEEALAAVQKVVAGQAEEYATTTAGKLEAANAKINDSMEKLGKLLLPAVAVGFELAGSAADAFTTSLDNVSTRSGTFSASAAPPLLNALSSFVTVVHAGTDEAASFIGQLTAAQSTLADVARESLSASEAADRADGSFADLSNTAFKGSDFFKQFTTDVKDTGAGLDQIGVNAIAAANGLDITHTAATGLSDAINNIPTFKTVTIQLVMQGAGAGADINHPLTAGGGADSNLTLDANGRVVTVGGDTGAHGDTTAADAARAAAARARQQAIDEAARKAKAQALADQRALTAAITDTYRTAKSLEDDYFARAHANRLKQISDTLALAKTTHDGALQAIQDNLTATLASNAKPVTAAQAALSNVQNQEQLRNLGEAADAAYTALQKNTDPTQVIALQTALRDAREALANFKAQLNINDLQAQQAVADAAAKDAAKKASDAADATYEAAQKKAKADTLTENQRYAALQKKFNSDLDTVLKETIKKHKSMNDALQALIQLIARYGGTSAGIPKVNTGKESQQFHITNVVNVPPITIGARAITSAMSTQISPSQSPFVRTGQVRPKFSPGQ